MGGATDELSFDDLIEFLRIIETHLDGPATLVGVGGTGLTLLGAKASTVDIDVTGPAASIEAFEQALGREPHGYRVDRWPDGTVFDVTLPDDYLERSVAVQARLERIDLRALHPVDIVVTKISRYDARDREDIRAAVDAFGIFAEDVRARAAAVERVGSPDAYEANLVAALAAFWVDG